MINWDKTGKTWHTDTKAGRYSVQRTKTKGPYAVFLNGERIMGEQVHTDAEIVKRYAETRIETARTIANEGACYIVTRTDDATVMYLARGDRHHEYRWADERKDAEQFGAEEAQRVVEEAQGRGVDACMILALSDKMKTTQKFWLASWATPEDADATNDDRQTAYDLACPVGVILMQYDPITIENVKKHVLADWRDSDDEFPLQAQWTIVQQGDDYINLRYHDGDHELGWIVITRATVLSC